MKIYFLLTCLALGMMCYGQDSTRSLFIKQVGWSVEIPAGFSFMDSSHNAEIQRNGKKLLEDANKIEADISTLVTLFTALRGKELFSSTIEPYNTGSNGSYINNVRKVSEFIYKTFEVRIPKATLDSSSSVIAIDGMNFNKFTVEVSIDERILFTTVLLARLHNGFDWGISYLYVTDNSRREIEAAIEKSKILKK
jgi:hypothetical protein